MTFKYPAYDDEKLQQIYEEGLNILPNGIYDFEVIKAEESMSKNNNPMTKLILNFFGDDGITYPVPTWLVATDKMIYRIKQFFECVGRPELYGKEMEDYEWLSLCGKAETEVEEQEIVNKVGVKTKMKFVKVTNFIPKENAKAADENLEDDDIPF